VTGFILENNFPEYVARIIIKVLNHSDISGINVMLRALVEEEFYFERTADDTEAS
jgi:hypothetical protein